MTGTPDATTPRALRDRYAIVGIGETDYTRGSGTTTRALATRAVRAAMADAGIHLGGRRPNNTSGGHLCEG